MTTDAYQGRNKVILRAPSSKMAHFDPPIEPFLQPGKAESETNRPKFVATVSNQTYSSITSDLGNYRHLSRKK